MFILVLLVSNPLYFYAQRSGHPHDINYDVIYDLAVQNPEKALEAADSLAQYAGTEEFKVNAFLLSAGIWADSNNSVKSIEFAKKALQIAQTSGNYKDILRVNLYLSEQFRRASLYKRGELYLAKADELLGKIGDDREKIFYRARINHESAKYAAMNGEYQNSIDLLQHVVLLYELLLPDKQVSLMIIEALNLEAEGYGKLEEMQKALAGLNKSLKILEETPEIKQNDFTSTYLALGTLFLKSNQPDSAEVYLTKAQTLVSTQNKKDLKIELYKNLKEFYKQTGDFEQYIHYVDLYERSAEEERRSQNEMINQLVETTPEVLPAKKRKSWKLPDFGRFKYYGLGLLLMVLGLGLSMMLLKNKRPHTSVSVEPKAVSHQTLEKSADKELSDENVEKISRKLEEFEAAQKFLDKEMSYSTLVGELETNEKYLNRFFKEVLNSNYNNYINGLRINYMVDRLKKDENWRSYKLTFLAEECGFSSYSAFTANFKNIMNDSPSNFLSKLK